MCADDWVAMSCPASIKSCAKGSSASNSARFAFWSTPITDHRKIVVVDVSHPAVSTGDQCVNQAGLERCRHGATRPGALPYFLDMWNGSLRTVENIGFRPDRIGKSRFSCDPLFFPGYVRPYADSPSDNAAPRACLSPHTFKCASMCIY